jgi:anti-sigma factor RsiW
MGRGCSVVIEMKSTPSVLDKDLNAYIDGQLPHNRQRDIERLIVIDDAVRVQVESLRRVRELARLAFPLNKKE